MKKYIVLTAVFILVSACALVTDNQIKDAQDKSGDTKQSMDHKSDFFVASQGVKDDYVFIFHIMPAPEGKSYSRVRYHLMVSVEKGGKPVTDLHLYSTVKHPDGSAQAKAPMMQVGDWYMTVYNLSHEKGRHWITASFERDGKAYSSGVYYPERKYHQ